MSELKLHFSSATEHASYLNIPLFDNTISSQEYLNLIFIF